MMSVLCQAAVLFAHGEVEIQPPLELSSVRIRK
jgi:hypothetical protein